VLERKAKEQRVEPTEALERYRRKPRANRYLFELAILEALAEHAVHHVVQGGVDGLEVTSTPELGVLINGFRYKGGHRSQLPN
jgi:hypothetical protein